MTLSWSNGGGAVLCQVPPSTEPASPWFGRVNGKPVPPGTYEIRRYAPSTRRESIELENASPCGRPLGIELT